MDEGTLAAAEERLATLQGFLAAFEAGGPPRKDKLLLDLRQLRTVLAKSTDEAHAVGAERDAVAQQVAAARLRNSKLKYQIAHLRRSLSGATAEGSSTQQAAAGGAAAVAAQAKQAQQARVTKLQQAGIPNQTDMQGHISRLRDSSSPANAANVEQMAQRLVSRLSGVAQRVLEAQSVAVASVGSAAKPLSEPALACEVEVDAQMTPWLTTTLRSFINASSASSAATSGHLY